MEEVKEVKEQTQNEILDKVIQGIKETDGRGFKMSTVINGIQIIIDVDLKEGED